MSIKMMFAAMNVTTGSPITKLVLVKLADNANDNGECWPSHETIAEICEMSVKSSQRHVNKLEELGLLSKQKRKGKNGNLSNFYQLNLIATNSPSDTETITTNSPLPSDRESLGGSDRESPESVRSFESVKEPKSMSEPDDSNPVTPIKKSITPYKKIHELYQTNLVETGEGEDRLVDVQVLDKERKARMKSFWMLMDRDVEKVERYFEWIWLHRENHIWLFGKNNRGWVADIEFLCREKTVRKARENQLSNWSDAA